MSDLDRIKKRLSEYYTNVEVEMWLDTPHPQLLNHRPRDFIRKHRTADVEAILDRLDSGAYL